MKTPKGGSAASRIEAALRVRPMTIDELCKEALGRVGTRERNLVRVNLHRLDERGLLTKRDAVYVIRS